MKPTAGKVRAMVLALAAAATLCPRPGAAGPKTDVMTLKNGDHVTGEIKYLDEGLLVYSTDNMGTLSIEWEDIAQLTSPNYFRVEVISGDIYYGSLLAPSSPGSLQVKEPAGNVLLGMSDVAHINSIHKRFWERFDGSLDVGFSFTQANNATQLSGSMQATYRVENAGVSFNASSLVNDQDNVSATSRQDASLSYRRMFGSLKRTGWFVQGQVQSNEELGIDLRVIGAGGIGKYMVQTYRQEFLLATGIAVNEEYAASSSNKFTNTELLGHLGYNYATYDYPKTQLSTMVEVYPSLSNWWRLRLELNAAVKREVVKDFFIKLSPFESYDSDPPEEGASKNDWGITTSLGWSF